jgi:hypothetical protein
VTQLEVLRAILIEMQLVNASLMRIAPPMEPEGPPACCDDPKHEPTGFGSEGWICRNCGAQGVD